MAIKVDREKMKDYKGTGGDYTEETMVIPAGPNLCRLVSYAELGKHVLEFNGKKKDPALMVKLIFEFPTCEYTGSFPLTIAFGDYSKNGNFLNSIAVSDKLASGEMSLDFANKTTYMKILNAMNKAKGTSKDSLAEFVGEAFLVDITHREGDKGKVFANFDATVIRNNVSIDPLSKAETEYPVPEAIGTYCKCFDWDMPTKEAWKALKPWDRKAIRAAKNFQGSSIADLLQANPELEKVDVKSKDTSEKDAADKASNAAAAPSEAPGTGGAAGAGVA